MFFGGWHSGLPIPLDTGFGRAVGALVLFLKSVFFLFVMIWVRWSLPRYRVDKVMYLCYKVLLPWSVVAVVVAAQQVLLVGGR
jgi:NADH-quinone oxidoreductase subunit H